MPVAPAQMQHAFKYKQRCGNGALFDLDSTATTTTVPVAYSMELKSAKKHPFKPLWFAPAICWSRWPRLATSLQPCRVRLQKLRKLSKSATPEDYAVPYYTIWIHIVFANMWYLSLVRISLTETQPLHTTHVLKSTCCYAVCYIHRSI